MAALLDIYNAALYRVKETPLVSAEENSRAAVAVSRSYSMQRPALLRRYRWQFALRRAELAPLSELVPFGWAYAFQLPADFISVVSVSTENNRIGSDVEYKIEGNRILSDFNPVYLVYVRDETDPAKFDPLFTETLVWAIASDLALALAADRELHVACVQNMERSLLAARRAGSIEQGADAVLSESRVLRARFEGGPRWPREVL